MAAEMSEQDEQGSTKEPRGRWPFLRLVMIVVIVATGLIGWRYSAPSPSKDAPRTSAEPPAVVNDTQTTPPTVIVATKDETESNEDDAEDGADAKLAAGLIGKWSNFYQGQRTLTVSDDGTAAMVIELTGIKAALFTARLDLEMEWSVEDGVMHRRNTGGHPPEKVDFVNRMYGDRVAERIVELEENRMVLEDEDRAYEWTRVVE